MSLEGFVRAAGAAMGLARDAFSTGTAGEVAAAAGAPALPGVSAPGAGQAIEAFTNESSLLGTHAVAVGEQDSSGQAQLVRAVTAAASGRERMNGVIAGATADVQALAPAAHTPQGQQALVTALTKRLQETQQVLQDGSAEAGTHAASSNATAAAYQAVVPSAASGAASALPAQATSMAAMPLAGLGSLGSAMGPQLGGLASNSGSQGTGTSGAGANGSAIDAVLSRALSQHGTPYSWGGGGKTGPGRGDDGRVGFDCSSLMQYAFAGAGVDLPRTTYAQIGLGHAVSPADIRPGDLIFSQFGEGGVPGPGHVQLALGNGHVVEAPHTGSSVRVSAMPAGHVVVRRILA